MTPAAAAAASPAVAAADAAAAALPASAEAPVAAPLAMTAFRAAEKLYQLHLDQDIRIKCAGAGVQPCQPRHLRPRCPPVGWRMAKQPSARQGPRGERPPLTRAARLPIPT
jgi:hypothetical protein